MGDALAPAKCVAVAVAVTLREPASAGVLEPVPILVPLAVGVPDALGVACADAVAKLRLAVGDNVAAAVGTAAEVAAARVSVALGVGDGVCEGVCDGVTDTGLDGLAVGEPERDDGLAVGEPERDGVALCPPAVALREGVDIGETLLDIVGVGDSVAVGDGDRDAIAGADGVAEDDACATASHTAEQPPADPAPALHMEPSAHTARAPSCDATQPAARPEKAKPGAQKARMPRGESTHARAGAAESAALGPQ